MWLCIYFSMWSIYDISVQPIAITQRMSENVPLWSICVCRAPLVSTINHPLYSPTEYMWEAGWYSVFTSHSSNLLLNKTLKPHHSQNSLALNSCWYFWVSEYLYFCFCCSPPTPTPTPFPINHSKVRPQIQTSWSEQYAKDVKHPGSNAGQLNKQTEHSVYHRRVDWGVRHQVKKYFCH